MIYQPTATFVVLSDSNGGFLYVRLDKQIIPCNSYPSVMNPTLQQTLEALRKPLSEADSKKLKLEVIQRLLIKLEREEHAEIEQDMERLIQQIPDAAKDSAIRKSFLKSLNAIQNKVKQAFGYVERGSLKGSFLGVGMAMGLCMGAGIGSVSEGMGFGVGLGMMIGLIIGLVMGGGREKKAEEAGLMY